jgi:hypothetical protein
MSDIHNWSPLASENNRAPPDGWPENTMTFGQINNSAREMMAVISRWFVDTSGILLATGLHYFADANAWGYRLNVHRAISFDLNTIVRFRIPQVNVGATWLSVNGSHPAWIRWPDNSNCKPNDLADVVEVYWHGSGIWVLNNLQKRTVGEFTSGSGVQMLFAMPAAPSGWVQSSAWHDRLIRVVSHAGTGAGGQWAIFGLSGETANHTHNVTVSGSVSGSTSNATSPGQLVESGNDSNVAAVSTHGHTYSAGFGPYVFGSTGASNAHTHVSDGSWRPAYGDVIMCIKA